MGKKHTYVLGTGLLHDGSACLLKDGRICVAIEKERITRIKHDGFNDTLAIEYCLDAEGITLGDIDLVVQNATQHMFEYGNREFYGPRLFVDEGSPPVVSISHHLAHAYSAIGTCPFDEFNILVIDGKGNSYDDCMDLDGAIIPDKEQMELNKHLYVERDSFYGYSNAGFQNLYKGFSVLGYGMKGFPMHPSVKDSIGGIYSAASKYCFRDINDVGKLMGLAPYGRRGIYNDRIFLLEDGRVFINYEALKKFDRPSRSLESFKNNFQYYADVAWWVQHEIEKAIIYIIQCRCELNGVRKLCYSGGVALNAVANARIRHLTPVTDLYVTPAAGDNGVAIGCAYYGWLEVLRKERIVHTGSTCFGKVYPTAMLYGALDSYVINNEPRVTAAYIDHFFQLVNDVPLNGLAGHEFVLQFNIPDYGVYQIVMEKDTVKGFKGFDRRPDGTFEISGDDFFRSIIAPEYLSDIIKLERIRSSNYSLASLFTSAFNFSGMARLLLDKKLHGKNDQTVKCVYLNEYIERSARLLADGKVLAWYQGRSEFGPRALGSRSILADPRNPGIKDFINLQIKLREDFRPFAPSVLKEDVTIYFEEDQDSPYMILVNRMKDEWKEKLKAITHVDGTSRVQTVHSGLSPDYYKLISEFKKITGISLLLNTSLNRRGMPIVETPMDALDFFYTSRIDYLIMDRFIIKK
ncbi:carbamoyltransferase C-terminal domain-containing protein [Flavitalea sp. BT771]|uniref:carbamoyltransferase family protein n=1 Tax=Flavitalea sp. BT771 TaxID=3063329 RepID=UPI0026E3F919|nr:carbamoyltransferase C-terminal domain-containing protein [Flavitalea sp. BT771]MDO6435459.1 carbamoyltransferase C-terminal domain-containing protein [Flavitalea sp. BT771]MDV6224359.1 carbamoyltransferase C-terminal domain-containing protein [Flavitalea sp. BT771]